MISSHELLMKRHAFCNPQKRKAKRRMIEEIGKCQNPKCGSKENLTIDHIISLKQGGTNAQTNWQVLCLFCNQNKRDKVIHS